MTIDPSDDGSSGAAALTRDELTWPVDRLPAIPSYELDADVAFARVAQRGKHGKVVLRVTDDAGNVPTP